MAEEHLQIRSEWRERLARAGLDSFDALMGFQGGQCCSEHADRQTFRVPLPDGQAVFLKRDGRTMLKHVLADWLRLQCPQPMTVKERLAIQRVAKLGIDTPEPVAWGQRRRRGLPWQGVMVTTCLPGAPLNEYVASRPPGEGRGEALAAVGAAVAKLYEADLSWPDLVPKHVFVAPGGRVGMLDLERLCPCRNARVRRMPRQVRRFCDLLRHCGADQGDLDALLDGLGYEDLVDYDWPAGE